MICCTPKTWYGVLSQWFLIHSFSTLFITLLTISLVCPTLFNFLTLQMPTPKMVKRIQTIHRLLLMNCLSLFDHFVGLALKGLIFFFHAVTFGFSCSCYLFNTSRYSQTLQVFLLFLYARRNAADVTILHV